MSASQLHPKVFISYSWSGVDHEKFVLELVTSLRSNGVDAILDKFRLKAGQDKYAFMESMVTDPDVVKVLILCDRQYKEKADKRTGGVGTETQIISQELYSKVQQTKFIPIVCERDMGGEPFLPVFIKSRIYVDLSSDAKYGEGMDELLRLIFDQPLFAEPQLGEAPAYLIPENAGTPIAKELPAVLRSIHEGKANRDGLERLFIGNMLSEITRQYVQPNAVDGYDEPIYQAILSTKGLRDQFSDYADAVACFSGDDPKSVRPSTHLLEQLGQKFGPPGQAGSFAPGWADIYRFFALESALILVAALIRHERWDSLRKLTSYPYSIKNSQGNTVIADVTAFDGSLVSLDEHRNRRLNASRVSLSADLLKERCSTTHTAFSEMTQADVFLALYGAVHFKESTTSLRRTFWQPRTAVYASFSEVLPLFAKAVDPDIRAGIMKGISISNATDLSARISALQATGREIGRLGARGFSEFDFAVATNLEVLVK